MSNSGSKNARQFVDGREMVRWSLVLVALVVSLQPAVPAWGQSETPSNKIPEPIDDGCYRVESFIATCNAVTGELQATATFADSSLDGETVLMTVADVASFVPVDGNVASLTDENLVGDVTVRLFQPSGIVCPEIVTEAYCGALAALYCSVKIEEVTLENCTAHECSIGLGDGYCTNRACRHDSHCSGITMVAKLCGEKGRCFGTATTPKKCNCTR